MKVHATLSNLRIAPRKVRLVTHVLVGKDVSRALAELAHIEKRAAQPISKLLRSAVANATNNFGLAADNLILAQILVGDGLRLKRWMPKAFGRATPVLKRCSNVTVILEELVAGKGARQSRQATAGNTPHVTATVPHKDEEPEKDHLSPTHPSSLMETKIKPGKAGFAKKMFQRKSV